MLRKINSISSPTYREIFIYSNAFILNSLHCIAKEKTKSLGYGLIKTTSRLKRFIKRDKFSPKLKQS